MLRAVEGGSTETIGHRMEVVQRRAEDAALGASGRALRNRLAKLLEEKQHLEDEVISMNADAEDLRLIKVREEVNAVGISSLREQKRELVQRLAELDSNSNDPNLETSNNVKRNYSEIIEGYESEITALVDLIDERREKISEFKRRLNEI